MLIPLSWLKDFVEIKLPLKDLMWKMTEAGLTCESYKKVGNDIVLDVEVTANRPDWMSIVGVAREVAAIQGVRIKGIRDESLPKKTANLPIDLIPDFKLFDRWTGIVVKDVKISQSPKWLADRIRLMGHSPINNVIDITNYVMYELGIPMHAFDYDEILGQVMTVQLSKGGENFTSVDNLSYSLPKDAIIIRDAERLIDLAGIKGGLNSGIKETTKNVFLHATIDNPVLVRRASIALGLRSEASAIYERVPDKGGTTRSIMRAAGLILRLAGGQVASDLIDLKKEKFEPWKITLTEEKLEKVLGIKIDTKSIIDILSRLNLAPRKTIKGIECTVPTYRADLKIEEDVAEEVARIYGYNKFPLTLPSGQIVKDKIPYYFDDSMHLKLKEILIGSGYTEVMTLSLISKDIIEKCEIKAADHVKLENPVSLEYEYMRATLIPSLISALKLNTEEKLKIFEIDKIYPSENYKLAVITRGADFREFKGLIDLILERLNISGHQIEFETDKSYMHQSAAGTIKIKGAVLGEFGALNPKVLSNFEINENVYSLEFDIGVLEKYTKVKIFNSVPSVPPQIEDVTLVFPAKTRIGDVINFIKSASPLVKKVELKDIYSDKTSDSAYKDAYTFNIRYQGKTNLTDTGVKEVREKILKLINRKFGGTLKD